MSVRSSDSTEISIHNMEWKGIHLTESAASRITQLSSSGQCFHLSVRPSGCTGFAYEVKLIEKPETTDLTFYSCGVEFYVALSVMPMLDGTEIDFVRQGLNSNFVYHNPNVKNMCGCGESFGV
ncbi:iron-sulfur cluster assembly accessory protein [Photobacterium carnosum]|uniref:iron-sulfur cluster assembly accessory protein n=1 Tax=Photobacterium TaxID=657 RepID=UPI001C8FF89A|nr:iron-sulfur cluster assembly accessory protein [Photobacterium carnosum]MBY3790323.1 iron-sulfur cluster assembly accessory protein [Photobacterium carnosum]MCD9496409.1 iron-sulfur cluster assembly accessory protein [Photobacterium carnosum]MCD9535366.1 iron-sulfur cluster assembly accessory protein [Photobacterium carnosum]